MSCSAGVWTSDSVIRLVLTSWKEVFPMLLINVGFTQVGSDTLLVFNLGFCKVVSLAKLFVVYVWIDWASNVNEKI